MTGRGPLGVSLAALFLPALLMLAESGAASPSARDNVAYSPEVTDSIAVLYEKRAAHLARLASAFAARFEDEETQAKSKGDATSLISVRRDVHRLRDAWKDVEFLAEHLDPGTAARLNPPPLPRVTLTPPTNYTLLNPEGLQALLEVAHGEELPGLDSLRALARRVDQAAAELAAQAARFDPATGREVLEDRLVFEAMSAQVVRVMTLGITGFDAPATSRSLPESRRSLEAMRPVLTRYQESLSHPRASTRQDARASLAKTAARLNAAVRALAHPDFDTFDRLSFIRTHGNPLLSSVLEAQQALGIATLADLGPLFQSSVDPASRNLFAPDFLDAHFFARVPGERPNAPLVELGRDLFFDPLLSGSGTQSCATCHHPDKAFSDGLPKSAAFFQNPEGTVGRLRNTPGLTYAAYQSAQFWDVRAPTLEKQIHHVVNGPGEFGTDFLSVLERLKKHPDYPARFREAYPGVTDDPVAVGTVTKALAQFMRSLPRFDSPFDRYMRGENDALDPAARRGFNLFAGKALCATCHFPPTFGGTVPPRYLETETEVLGVPEVFPAPPGTVLRLDDDPGRFPIHYAPPFLHAFKTPSLRNVALTAPYMHNGGMKSLEDVLDFYNAGGGAGLGLDVPNQTLPSDSLGLTRQEKADIVAFMRALTDGEGEERRQPGP